MIDKKLDKYISGYTSGEEFQDSYDTPGDPQLSALISFIQSKNSLNKNNAIIDFGSGKGILAQIMAEVWNNDIEPPMYIAIDFEKGLNSLSLPTKIHNNSKKISIDNFYNKFEQELIDKIELVIIRNVFHELNIIDTSKLVYRLISLNKSFSIYIQDMHNLPKAERGNAGWNPRLFEEYLNECGFKTSNVILTSHGGTKWFSLNAGIVSSVLNFNSIHAITTKHKEKLRDILLKELQDIYNNRDENQELAIIGLQNDITSIELQLAQNKYDSQSIDTEKNIYFQGNIVLSIKDKVDSEYVHMMENAYAKNGLIGIIVNKKIIDFPDLFIRCKQKLKMFGYSLFSLFNNQDSCSSLFDSIVKNNINVQLLVCNPESKLASLRNTEILYSNESLLDEINQTLVRIKDFRNKLPDSFKNSFEVRLFDKIAYSSHIIIDNMCITSSYSNTISGSNGSSFIYIDNSLCQFNNFKVFEQEFENSWNESLNFIDHD